MKLPRDTGGEELAQLLARYGYRETRQAGSHLRLTAQIKGVEHHVTIPAHKPLKIGTLIGILNDVAESLGISRDELVEELFGH